MGGERQHKLGLDCAAWRATCLAAGLAAWLASCGGSSGTAPATPLAPDSTGAAPAAPDTHQQALLEALPGLTGGGGPPREVASAQFALQGMDYVRWSGLPSRVLPDPAGTLRLVADGTQPMAYAAYELPASLPELNGIAKRLRVNIAAAPAGGGTQPLEYYVGLANYTQTRWHWQGPFTTPKALALNSPDVRERYFDLNGATTAVVAVYGKPGRARAADIASIEFESRGYYVPVKPYRPDLSDAQWTSTLYYHLQTGSHYASNRLQYDNDAGPFAALGHESVTLLRRPSGSAEPFEQLATTLPPYSAQQHVIGWDPPVVADDELPLSSLPFPGTSYDYALILANAQGSAPLVEAPSCTTLFDAPRDAGIASAHLGIDLNWRGQAGVDEFEIFRDGTLLATVPAAPSSFTYDYFDATAVPDEPHTYFIRATAGPYTKDSAQLTAAAGIDAPSFTRVQPNVDSIALEWTADGYASLELYRDGALLADLPASQAAYDDTAAVPGTRHEYYLRGLYASGQKDSAAAAELRWAWPAYLLSDAPVPGYGTGHNAGQFADLAGHPALMTGAHHGAPASFSMFEASSATPDGPEDWAYRSPEFADLESGNPALSPLWAPRLRNNFAAVQGQPYCAMHVAGQNWTEFDITLGYRQQNTPPPLPPEMLDWFQSWQPVSAWVDTLSVADVGGRPAMIWRDQSSLSLRYARATALEPQTSADWTSCTIVPQTSAYSVLAAINGQPCALVSEGSQLRMYRSAEQSPDATSDWTRIQVAASGAVPLALCSVDGKPFAAYRRGSEYWYSQALVALPMGLADWQTVVLAPSPAEGDDLRVIELDGRPAVLFANTDGMLQLMVGLSAQPASAADWKTYLLDSQGYQADLIISGGVLSLAYFVAVQSQDHLRQDGGWHIVHPPLPLP